jgi:hypothetical protein
MNYIQRANLDEILGIIQTFEVTIDGETRVLTPEEAYTAAWIAYAESRYRQYAVNPTSNASGIYQYTDGTWTASFNRYGTVLGYGTDIGEKARWDGSRFDIDLQTKVFLLDTARFLASMNENDGMGATWDWDRDGSLGRVTAREAMEYYGVPWTEENYLYLRHHTDVREVKAILFDRLVNSEYTEVEQFVESSYGQQLPDNYEDPSLEPLIQQLADLMRLDISGMNSEQALIDIKLRLSNWTTKGVNVLRNFFAGYRPWDDAVLWKYDPTYRYTRWFTLEHARESFITAETAWVGPSWAWIPLVMDLDGDGVETTNLTDGSYFDHDSNGFGEQTGWASPDDGLLAWDRNGDGIINDGTELFNDPIQFPTATNGFQVLAQLDDNVDGKIDSNDAVWSQLKVWRQVGMVRNQPTAISPCCSNRLPIGWMV